MKFGGEELTSSTATLNYQMSDEKSIHLPSETELINRVESGVHYKEWATEPIKRETLAERLQRLKLVKPEDIVSGQFSWIDEVMLVALGKKPIAVTHFDSLDPEIWDEEIEDWCVEQKGVCSFAVMDCLSNIKVTDTEPVCFEFETKEGGKGRYIMTPENQVGIMVWFRPETRKQALLARYHHRLQMKGKDWAGPHFHIVQGLLEC